MVVVEAGEEVVGKEPPWEYVGLEKLSVGVEKSSDHGDGVYGWATVR